MFVMLCFTCQSQSSIAEINSQTNSVIFKSIPGLKLSAVETNSCILQTNYTAVYTITIGTNVFRSNFVKYNAFAETTIELLPVNGSSTEDAIKFSIASYEITFLENTLTQTASVGQLLQTYYDYNQCILGESIDYETFQYIKPIIQTNPKCIIKPTDNVIYSIQLEHQTIFQNKILLANYNFSNLALESISCTSGTEEYKKQCSGWTELISGRNFIGLNLQIVIPKTITTQNLFTDDYGVKQNKSVTYNFNMTFNISVTQRLSAENCTKDNHISFQNSTVFVFQTPQNDCPTDDGDSYNYWVTASELADNSGKTFQLQFYNDMIYRVNKWVTCATWEISGFEGLNDCNAQLQLVQTYPSNMSVQISYIVIKNKLFDGAIRFSPSIIPSGEAELILTQGTLCVKIDKEIPSSRSFVDISIKLSADLNRFQQEQLDFQILNNFLYPSVDNTYCYQVTPNQQNILNHLGFDNSFGTVSLQDNMLIVKALQNLVEYDDFWQGWIFLFGSLCICFCWLIIKSCMRKRKAKTMK